jgi:hypothetical protein
VMAPSSDNRLHSVCDGCSQRNLTPAEISSRHEAGLLEALTAV